MNRPSALRDVAKYAKVADLRVGGVDLDGKSFDSPKFAKQNLITYTIGFKVNNAVLPAAASVGGGKYYTADNKETLKNALQGAVNDIKASKSNAGGLATQNEITSSVNKVFQPIFNPSGWYGELRCFNLGPDGSVGAACSPNAKAVIPTATDDRKIYTSRVLASSTSKFDFVKTNLGSMLSGDRQLLGSNLAAQGEIIDFVRGVEGVSANFRSRKNADTGEVVLLGDIIDGQPVVVSAPSGFTPDSAYVAFKSANANRSLVFVGANDGMAHAFDISDMTEVMGYIPQAVYPRLKDLSASDYGAVGGTSHVYHVNGAMRKQDIKVDGNWQTILVGGLGQGGQGYYALNVTDKSVLGSASTAIQWEFNDKSDASMGFTFGAPLIYNVRTSATDVTPAVIFSNGYESSYDDSLAGGQKTTGNASKLYIVSAATGELITSISVPYGGGLSAPAGVDYGQDGILDYVYAGDLNGKLWRFDLTADAPTGFNVATNPIFDAGAGNPIAMRPAVIPVNKASDGSSLGNLILFGTGQLLQDADRKDTTTQHLYGILDKLDLNPTTVPNTIGLSGSLVLQEFDATLAANTDPVDGIRNGTYRRISSNPIDLTSDSNTKLGWKLPLPDASERLVTTPIVFSDKVIFGTGVPLPPSDDNCLPGGKGWIIGLNPLTGSVVRKGNKSTGKDYSFIDMDGDKKSKTSDQLAFGGSPSYISAYSKDGIPTELTVVSSDKMEAATGGSEYVSTVGSVIALGESNSMAVYTGNAPNGVKRGPSISRPGGGTGKMYGGTVGNDTLDEDTLTAPEADAVRIFTTTFREIR